MNKGYIKVRKTSVVAVALAIAFLLLGFVHIYVALTYSFIGFFATPCLLAYGIAKLVTKKKEVKK